MTLWFLESMNYMHKEFSNFEIVVKYFQTFSTQTKAVLYTHWSFHKQMIFNTLSCSSLTWKCVPFMVNRSIFGSMLPIDESRPSITCHWSTDLPNSVDRFYVQSGHIQQGQWRTVVTPLQLLTSNCLIQLPMSLANSWHWFLMEQSLTLISTVQE